MFYSCFCYLYLLSIVTRTVTKKFPLLIEARPRYTQRTVEVLQKTTDISLSLYRASSRYVLAVLLVLIFLSFLVQNPSFPSLDRFPLSPLEKYRSPLFVIALTLPTHPPSPLSLSIWKRIPDKKSHEKIYSKNLPILLFELHRLIPAAVAL